MGERIPEPPDDYGPGNDCPGCWAPGKTPNYLFVRFWDVEPCPGKPNPPNGYCFICAQLPTANCIFHGTLEFGGETWACYYDAHARYGDEYRAELLLVCSTLHLVASFSGRVADCGLYFPDNLANCDGWSGKNGRGIVTIYIDPILILLTDSFGFYDLPGILYDSFDVASPNAVYHIAHVADKTNVLFLVDKDEL